MQHTKLNRYIAAAVFLISMITYWKTMPPTVVFWDVPEHSAASYGVQVQHPPGSPLLVLVMRVASMIPVVSDIAARMVILNMLLSSLVVMLLYLITIRLKLIWREEPSTVSEQVAFYGSAILGSLALTFCTTFWFNSIELETRNISLFFTATIIWLALLWHERADEKGSDKYLLMIAYLVGLASGVHIHGMLGFFVAIMIVYFRSYNKPLKQFFSSMDIVKFGAVGGLIFFSAYPGVIKWFPSMLDGEVFGYKSDLWIVVAVGIIALAVYLAYDAVKKSKRIIYLGAVSFLLIVLGFTTYTTVYIRANAKTPMNENNPNTMGRLVIYLEREQYGETPLFKRMWSPEPDKVENHKKYTSDLDYLWEYQIKHMYLRYLGWNFIGKEADWQDAGIRWSQLYGIPFFIGLFGFYYHWKRDPKSAFTMTAFFLLTGIALAFYFNMQEQQPRERDYFFVYSFFGFCVWIGMGVLEILDLIKQKFSGRKYDLAVYGVLALAFLFVPGNMLRTNYGPMSRHGHYLAWDHSYNMLQSCEKDAILVTNGDNDTFPLWYLQDVEGIRRDIRVVCLSLLNTDWYIKQLKNEQPHGAKKVPISIPDNSIDGIQPVAFQSRMMDLTVPQNAKEPWRMENRDPEGLKVVDTLRFLMPHTVQFGSVTALRVQDVLIYDIIRTSNWQRPIYFAMTVGDEAKIGLHEYMEMQGLAMKLVPRKSASIWGGMNEERVRKHLFVDPQQPSKEPAFGFRWRGLQDSTIHFDENQRRLLYNYRRAFLFYTFHTLYNKLRPQDLTTILDRMEQVVPRRVVGMDNSIKFQVASLYNMAGNQPRCAELSREIVADLEPIVQKGVSEPLSDQNPYLLLIQAYEWSAQYQQALDLLGTIGRVYSTAPGIEQYISERTAQLGKLKAQADSVAMKR